jgi:hypothetical protein
MLVVGVLDGYRYRRTPFSNLQLPLASAPNHPICQVSGIIHLDLYSRPPAASTPESPLLVVPIPNCRPKTALLARLHALSDGMTWRVAV